MNLWGKWDRLLFSSTIDEKLLVTSSNCTNQIKMIPNEVNILVGDWILKESPKKPILTKLALTLTISYAPSRKLMWILLVICFSGVPSLRRFLLKINVWWNLRFQMAQRSLWIHIYKIWDVRNYIMSNMLRGYCDSVSFNNVLNSLASISSRSKKFQFRLGLLIMLPQHRS